MDKESRGRFWTFGSLIVATPEVVYIKDGNGVLCLDAETGSAIKRFALSDDPQTECRWLTLQDGILVTILGPRPKENLRQIPGVLPRVTVTKADGKPDEVAMFTPEYKWFQDYDQGTAMVATDVTSGKELWRVLGKIDPAKTALAGNRVFFYADRSYASALDLKSGQTIWKTDAPIAKEPFGLGYSLTFMITARVGALASPDIYLINSYKDGHYQAFSGKDGSKLWGEGHGRDKPSAKGANDDSAPGQLSYPLLMDEKLLTPGGAFFDVLTGKQTGAKLSLGGFGCGPFCASTHDIHMMTGTAYDRDTKTFTNDSNSGTKPACLTGVVPADGLLFSSHGDCGGCVEWLGHIAYCSANGFFPPDPTSPAADCLLSGQAVDKASVEAPTSADWTTYRANNSRSGSSSATVPSAAKIAWTWTPHPLVAYDGSAGLETQSTQPICVGDRVYFGTAVGIVRCLDRKTGKELWNYPTAGRIISSPSFWEGKLYVGSGDGRLYCLNAADGSLVWRYRVAPVERRTMVYGHLMSSWPINANVMVQPSSDPARSGAVAYASAGLMGDVGGYLCALDARTGKLRWGTRLNASAQGQMAWYDRKIWLHASGNGVFVVDPLTGNSDSIGKFSKYLSGLYGGMRGQDIGILPGGWVVAGGRIFYLQLDADHQQANTCTFLRAGPEAISINTNGYPDALVLDKAHGTDIMPAWDAKETLLYGLGAQRPVLCSGLGDMLTSEVTVNPPRQALTNFKSDLPANNILRFQKISRNQP